MGRADQEAKCDGVGKIRKEPRIILNVEFPAVSYGWLRYGNVGISAAIFRAERFLNRAQFQRFDIQTFQGAQRALH